VGIARYVRDRDDPHAAEIAVLRTVRRGRFRGNAPAGRADAG